MKPSEILYKAADRIQEGGWWQDGDGGQTVGASPTCASNAISEVCRADMDFRTLRAAQTSLLTYLDAGEALRGIFVWNDAPGRTASEVIEVLRACAVIEASREREAAEVTA